MTAFGAFDPGTGWGLGIYREGFIVLAHGKLKGRTFEARLLHMSKVAAPDEPLKDWIVERPMHGGPRSRLSASSLNMMSGSFVGLIRPEKLELLVPQSWNWQGRGKERAHQAWRVWGPSPLEPAQLQDDELSALGMILVRTDRDNLPVRGIREIE